MQTAAAHDSRPAPDVDARFGFSASPFRLSPDPAFFFDSRSHRPARLAVREALGAESGFVVVTGEIGAGKTLLVRTVLAELDPAALAVAHVVSTQLDAAELLASAAIAFGIRADAASPPDTMRSLLAWLVTLAGQGRRALVVVDEAQNLAADALQALVDVAARRAPQGLPLVVCLVGQPELREQVASPALHMLRDRLALTCHLGPIDPSETGAYIEHRLRHVGWSGVPAFTRDAVAEIARCTDGIPRRINVLCSRLLLHCLVHETDSIDRATVVAAVAELRDLGGHDDAQPLPARAAHIAVHTPMPRPAPTHGTLLLLARSHADHVQAAALMHACAGRAGAPTPRLVRVHDNDALRVCEALFAGVDADAGALDLHVAEDDDDAAQRRALGSALGTIVERTRPRALVVFDSSVAALAGSSVARAHDVPVVHVGAGLRTPGMSDAEIAARRQADQLADLLYTADRRASATLVREGVPPERIHCVGNLLADALHIALHPRGPRPADGDAAGRHAVLADGDAMRRRVARGVPAQYALVVLDQAAQLDERQDWIELLTLLRDVSRDVALVWPMGERVASQLKRQKLADFLAGTPVTRLPLAPYPEHARLLRDAVCVLTASRDAQQEAAALRVPCLAVGPFAESAIAMPTDSTVLVGLDRALATRAVWQCLFADWRQSRAPELWDGRTGARIAGYLAAWLAEPSAFAARGPGEVGR